MYLTSTPVIIIGCCSPFSCEAADVVTFVHFNAPPAAAKLGREHLDLHSTVGFIAHMEARWALAA